MYSVTPFKFFRGHLETRLEGKSPVEVTAKLNLPGSQVQQFYTKYWELNNMHELNTIYNEVKDNIGYFITLFRFAKEEQLTPEEVIGLINMSNDILDLKRQYKRLNVSIVNLESILYESKEELKKLKNQAVLHLNSSEVSQSSLRESQKSFQI